MPTKIIGNQQLDLADDYAKALDTLSNRSVSNTTASLTRALLRTLRDLRKYYAQFIDPDLLATPSGDGVIRRPGSYSIADGSAKYKKLIQLAQEYMPEPMIKGIERQYKKDFEEAVALGGELGQKLASTVEENADGPFVGASKAAVEAAAKTASAYIRGEIESFRDNIARIVTDGIGRGKGPRVLEREIRTALLGARDPQGLNARMGLKQRAELIARSELANAYVAAQKASAARNGYVYGRWIATQDERTCVVCASRHGKIYRLDEMVGTLHPRCVLGDVKVSPGPFSAIMRSRYRGNVITIRLDDGSSLTVTAQHPVLTPAGVKTADRLCKGDDLIGDSINILTGISPKPDFHQVPARAEDIFTAFSQSGAVSAVSVPVSPLDLHGDGRHIDGNVNVVRAAGLFEGYWKTKDLQDVGDVNGAWRGMGFRPFSTLSLPDLAILGLAGAACGRMSFLGEAQTIFAGGLSHAEIHRVAASAWRDSALTQPVGDDGSANSELFSECFDAFPGLIQTHKVVDVDRSFYSGHVYTFETFSGYYFTGSKTRIISQNCRCSLSPVSTEAVEENDPEVRRELLREDFWEKEREKVWKEFGDSKGWPFEKASKKLEEAVLKPSPSERRQYPGITRAPEPVI